MLFKVLFKAYELLLRTFRPINIEYFCQIFPSQVLPDEHTKFAVATTLHILVPFRDRWELTEQCLNSVLEQDCTDINCHLHLIDNGSRPEIVTAVQTWLERTQKAGFKSSYQRDDQTFNFSRLCNAALDIPPKARGHDYFLFLNNDVVLNNVRTFQQALGFAEGNTLCGALGITLLFPDQTIQHLFAAPGVKIIAAHPFKGRPKSILTQWNQTAHQVPAITGAFLIVPARAFHNVGGFDEQLPTTGQDIDLCLKLQKLGLRNWVLPQLQAIHFESASRRNHRINLSEVDYIYAKWQQELTAHPQYPISVSRWSEQPVFSLGEGAFPYKRLL